MSLSRVRKSIAAVTATLVVVSGLLIAPTAAFAEEESAHMEATLNEEVEQNDIAPEAVTETSPEEPRIEKEEVGEPDSGTFSNDDAQITNEAPAQEPKEDGVIEPLTEPEVRDVDVEEDRVWPAEISVSLSDGTPLHVGDTVYKGDTLIVSGSGFDPTSNPSPHEGVVPKGQSTGHYVVFGKFLEQWRPSAGAASDARATGDQIWAMTADVLNNHVAEKYRDIVRSQWAELTPEGKFVTELKLDDPSGQNGAQGVWPENGGSFGVFTYAAGGVKNADQEREFRLNYVEKKRPVVWTPEVQVFQEDGVTPLAPEDPVYDGDRLVVRGSGFDPAANVGGRGMPIPKTLPQGSYVVFGNFLKNWKPSTGAASDTRASGSQGWVLTEDTVKQVPDRFQDAVREQWVNLNADGTWETTLEASEVLGKDGKKVDGRYGVYTYGAGGVDNASQELEILLEYVDEQRPVIAVFRSNGVTPLGNNEPVYDGDTIVIKGTGFDPQANVGGRGMPIPSTLPQGSYVVFGDFLEQWQPSSKAPSSARAVGDQRWVLTEDTVNQIPDRYKEAVQKQWVELANDGTWTAKLTVSKVNPKDRSKDQAGRYGVYTYAGGGMENASQELEYLLNYQGERPSFKPEVSVELADGSVLKPGDTVYKGDELVVKGTGFDPQGNIDPEGRGVPIPKDLPQGTYVVFGKFLDDWKPSQGAPSDSRKVGPQRWALAESVLDQVPVTYQKMIRALWSPLSGAGEFEATLTVGDLAQKNGVAQEWPSEGRFGVYTYAAGGAINAEQETTFELNYVEEERPTVTAYLADGVTPPW